MKPAITTKDINVNSLGIVIPKGTKFLVGEKNEDTFYAVCSGLYITLIWNDEFEYIED